VALAEAHSGSPTIGSTEYSLPNGSTTLTPRTTPGIYSLMLDLAALASGDSFRVRIYEKATASASQRLLRDELIVGLQEEPLYVAPALHLMHGWDFTLVKVTGTDRQIPFSIRSVS
jgi:hypothetical protein